MWFSRSNIVSKLNHIVNPPSGRHYGEQYGPTYHDYDHFPPQGNLSVSGLYSSSVGCYQPYGNTPNYAEQPPTPPSPSERSESPPPAHGMHSSYYTFNTLSPVSQLVALEF